MQLMERSMIVASLEDHISEVQQVLAKIPIASVERVVQIVLEAYERQGHLYIIGNGGSASTATHFACDLSKATIVEGRARLRVTSLTDNIALLTAWANDTSYKDVFAEQLANLLNPGDVVVAISASGESRNMMNPPAAEPRTPSTAPPPASAEKTGRADRRGRPRHLPAAPRPSSRGSASGDRLFGDGAAHNDVPRIAPR